MKEINNRAEELIQNIHTSIVRWYPFKPDSDIVYIGGEDAILCWLKEQYGKHVNSINPDIIFENSIESVGKADYIVSIATPEQIQNPGILLSWMRTHLKSTGRLILGMNNRLGIRYFCGDRDLYTERNFDGIEDYFRAYKSPDDRFVGRAYDRAQLTEMLTRAGFDDQKFYSVFSDLGNASFLFADGYVPNEELQIRIFPTYNSSSTVFLEEERLYTALLKNGLFHEMANAFLIECSLDGAHTDALQVTGSLDRGREDALITIIHENGTVTKKAPFQEGTEKLSRLNDNMKYLQSKGVNVVPGELNGDIYTMPLINAETGMVYLQRLLSENPDLFLQKMDESLKAAVGAGCSKIIVHPIFACIGPDEEWEVNRSFYLSLNSLACELGSDIRILLINSAKDINGHLVRGICAEPEQANKWVDALNEECGRERFDFCFDLGVATLCCQDVY